MPRALITGAAGFVGRWLARALVRRGWDVTGAPRPGAARPTSTVALGGAGDVRDGAHLAAALDASHARRRSSTSPA